MTTNVGARTGSDTDEPIESHTVSVGATTGGILRASKPAPAPVEADDERNERWRRLILPQNETDQVAAKEFNSRDQALEFANLALAEGWQLFDFTFCAGCGWLVVLFREEQ